MKFTEHKKPTYPPRTQHNAQSADLTVAFAEKFDSGGEVLTHSMAGDRYVGIALKKAPRDAAIELFRACKKHNAQVLNVAGNGIYTLKDFDWTQESLNLWAFQVMKFVHDHHPFKKVISGGQTGVDWAGGVAAEVLGIPGEMTFPKGYMQRTLTEFKLIQTKDDVERKFEDDVRVLRGMLVEMGIKLPEPVEKKPEPPEDLFELC
ncbi:hypothetical protein IFT48_00870 [Pseudomonas fluorescens]|uniref:hypothetical protein n=1 Tax=Pseudomonas TaxID=286 RepID=UPI000F012604|nr:MULTISPECIES: hypothetical protein [Pseudomonas]MBD8088544.1 hypothetical protein [Pseudomonas fluorescens]MBD8614995.1 hypothetical protein [Pseudomonas putida]MBD8681322.1 hypothetical protein [Pseudomonas sp. CFBP 13719]